MIQDIVIIDLDGTLCNTKHRDHLAEVGEWDQFHSLLHHDTPHWDVVNLLRMIPPDDIVLVITGRNERWRQATMDWLQNWHLAQYVDEILMRPDDDFNKSSDVKIKLLSDWLQQRATERDDVVNEIHGLPPAQELAAARVKFALDDREKVIDAYRAFGIPCWQVRAGVY